MKAKHLKKIVGVETWKNMDIKYGNIFIGIYSYMILSSGFVRRSILYSGPKTFLIFWFLLIPFGFDFLYRAFLMDAFYPIINMTLLETIKHLLILTLVFSKTTSMVVFCVTVNFLHILARQTFIPHLAEVSYPSSSCRKYPREREI